MSRIISCRSSSRDSRNPEIPHLDVGFRCVWSKDPPEIPGGEKILQPVELPRRLRNPKDNAEMILIPGGEFIMGSDDSDKFADEDEKPQRKVTLKPYYIYKYEVTNEQYDRFVRDSGYSAEGEWSVSYNRFSQTHPVSEMSFIWWVCMPFFSR